MRMVIRFLILFLIITVFSAKADNVKKGFERLKVFDYFSAKEYFEKSLKGEMPAGAYGLSAIYSSDKNPFYNPDSARRYILISDSTYRIAKERKKKYYRELGVSDSSINALSDFICNDAFQKARKSDSVDSYSHFISNFYTCFQFGTASSMRNASAFRDARTKNTSAAFKEFIASYPQSDQYQEAMSKYEERIFDENTTERTVESYAFFIQNYPESPYRTQAEKLIYTMSTPNKTLHQYVAYAREYKSSRFNEEAWHEIYKLEMKDFSQQAFDRFKITYPDYPFPQELEIDFRLQNYFFLPYRVENGWGYLNELGQPMIKPVYDEAALFSEGLAVVAIDGKYGYINKSGKSVISLLYKDAESFHNGSAVVLKDSLYGVINKSGEFLIDPLYEDISEAGDDIFMCVKDNRSGYISKKGKPITQFIFDVAGDFKNGYAVVNKDEKYGLVNLTGSYNIEPEYEDLSFIGNGILKAQNEEEQWGVLDVQGNVILPFLYDAIGEFSEHRALIAKNGKCGFIDETGAIVIPIIYRYSGIMLTTGKFNGGFSFLQQKYKSIIIDTTGYQISIFGSEDYGPPSGGFIPVRKNRKWGFSDMSGKIKIPVKYEAAESFYNGYAKIKLNKMTGVIDSTGSIFIQALYEDITIMDNCILIRSGGKSGLLTKSGILLVPCQYDKIEFISSFVAKGSDTGGFTYVNLTNGKIIYNSVEN